MQVLIGILVGLCHLKPGNNSPKQTVSDDRHQSFFAPSVTLVSPSLFFKDAKLFCRPQEDDWSVRGDLLNAATESH